MSVYLRDTTRARRFDASALARTAKRLLRAIGEQGSSLSLSFVGDAAIRRLNREHRGMDHTTDVLSFPLYEPEVRKGNIAGGPERMLGDIVIGVEQARRQALDYDATLEAELKRLLIHGLLHLVGHDHEVRDERARMEGEERRLAAAIGLRWPYDPASAADSRGRGRV